MLSIIIPCFNHAATLLRAVDSARKVRGVAEIIIVDDCSSDGSPALIASLCTKYDNVQGVRNATNSGPAASRNLGAKAARGEYLCFLDADDELINSSLYEDSLDVIGKDSSIRAVKPMEEFFDPVKGYILLQHDPRYASAVLSSVHGLVISNRFFTVIGGFPESDVFRGAHGGEDVAFMQALIEYGGPLGKVETVSYRVWSQDGGHVDRFLSNTRLSRDGFAFILGGDAETDALSVAINEFKSSVYKRMGAVLL
jgi:glycosyltransferase involved in cell wall biosynthesis